ncbi:LysR family transcriptional regulator [Enterovibrio norvegicus FF-33]|uniref:LysR family transcriptional regulator n=1 Tax=Enterovibrio norvegicus FF-454 TaxID=1185651 RepID=A0A1E5CBR2_9GAMM|nr:LysR substrate-binding domain-containing protein [Enterovibrio norvegicus]OEE62946.1 LysR family transcriptional regulator [Enterovibrio norvegicus FF-454]OEE66870.1 LysR family transcriptional regulator [Enterovibrio norvegicus FF-33]OEE74908.1 LysR family transcriptional regulator [Enterovibrio norvegicus FF-162]
MTNFDIDQLRTLVAIVDCGNFAAAANSVHRTQSAVSMQMKKLEEVSGVALFQKQGRRHVLTSHGMTLVSYARQMLVLNDEAMAHFHSPEMNGIVKLGVCDDYVNLVFRRILTGFSERYPNLQLSVQSNSSQRLLKQVLDGRLDLALINIHDQSYPATQLFTEKLVWAKAKHITYCKDRPLPLAIEVECRWGRLAMDILDRASIPYQVVLSAADFHGLNAAIESGMAVSLIAACSVTEDMDLLEWLNSNSVETSIASGLSLKPGASEPAVLALADYITEWYMRRNQSAA